MARRALAFLPLLLSVALFAATYRSPDSMRAWLVKSSYYNIALFAACAAFGLLRRLRDDGTDVLAALKARRTAVFAAAALSGVVFLSVTPRLRVLPDETVLMSVSRSMTFDKSVEVVSEAQRYFDTFYPENVVFELQPRPHLFPFLLSVIHTVTGYRIANAFVLNALVLWALLALIYVWTEEAALSARHSPGFARACALSAMLLTISQPVVTLSAASGGYDLMAALCVLLSLRALRAFLSEPGASRFETLWIALLALACVRYEGAVYLAVSLAGLFLFGLLRADYFANSPGIALTPVFFLPFVWQRLLVPGMFHPEPGQIICSPSILWANTAIFLKSAFRRDGELPYASLVNLAGFAAVLFFLREEIAAWKRGDEDGKSARRFAAIAAACLLAHWTSLASFYFSQPDSPSASRYFGVFAVVLAGLSVALASRADFFKNRPSRLILAAAAIFLFYHPTAIEDRGGRSLALPREHAEVMDYLKDKKNFLVVADMPSLYTVYGYGAVGFRRAAETAADLRARFTTRLIGDIFVVQEIDLKTGAPITWQTLPPEFALETLSELRTRTFSAVRLSKVRRL